MTYAFRRVLPTPSGRILAASNADEISFARGATFCDGGELMSVSGVSASGSDNPEDASEFSRDSGSEISVGLGVSNE